MLFGLNLTCTIDRPTRVTTRGGDRDAVASTTVATLVPCARQQWSSKRGKGGQQYLPGGQVIVRYAEIYFNYGVDVKWNDFLTLSDGTKWRVENVVDDAGRSHHLVVSARMFD
jgi:hypothetical protein